ncbi:hypothetical protein [Priestia endophytica]|nr:hypothetical protein [Priestia endophytica]
MDYFYLAKDVTEQVFGEAAKDFIGKIDETVEFDHNFIRDNGMDILEFKE